MTKKRNNLSKRITCLTLILSLLFAIFSFTAIASNDIKVFLDGQPITFDVPPQIINGRTMVPMRAIFEAMGASVDWDESKKAIGAMKGSTLIIMVVGEKSYLSKDGVATLDVAPQIVNGRTLVPVRAIAECFDCNVTWDNTSRTVFINNSNNSKNNSVLKFYNNTTIPTYESATNSNLLRKIDSSVEIRGLTKDTYVYNYNLDGEKQYVNVLTKYGFQEIQNFDEFRVFANPSTGERVLLQGANGGDGSSTIWIRIGLGTSASATTDSSYDAYNHSFEKLKNYIIQHGNKRDDSYIYIPTPSLHKATTSFVYDTIEGEILFYYLAGSISALVSISENSNYFNYVFDMEGHASLAGTSEKSVLSASTEKLPCSSIRVAVRGTEDSFNKLATTCVRRCLQDIATVLQNDNSGISLYSLGFTALN